MRHVRSILYALVLAPAVWVLCGVGFTGDLIGRARDNGGIESLTGLLLLLLAGAAYAILVFAPISPAGPLLGGLTFLGVGLWALAEPASYTALWPADLSKEGFDLSLPGYGLAIVLAVPMICTALSARRWARYEPPVLPLIGTLGRARGAAAVAGIPISVTETSVLTPPARMVAPEPPTQAVPTEAVPTLVLPPMPAPDYGSEATTLLPATSGSVRDDEPVTVLRLAAPSEGEDEATALLPPPPEPSPAADDDATTTITQAASADADKPTTVLAPTAAPDGDDERTQLLQQPGDDAHTAAPTEDLVGPAADGPTDDRDLSHTTREFGPGEKTRVIARNPGETTQVIRAPGAVYPPPGETTRAIPSRPGTAEPHGERTQVIKVSAPPAPADDAERPDPTTTLLPVQPDEETTVEQRPGEAAASPAGEDSIAERPMTVLNMERPPDEVEEDTRPLAVPTQRQPPDDIDQPPS